MAWVNDKWDKNSTERNVRSLEVYLENNPDLWTRLHDDNESKKRKRSDELNHCMLHYYTEQFHRHLEERKRTQELVASLEQRAARLYVNNRRQADYIAELQDSLHERIEESTRLFDAAMAMTMLVNPRDRAACTTAITNAVVGEVDVIDLTTNETVSDEE